MKIVKSVLVSFLRRNYQDLLTLQHSMTNNLFLLRFKQLNYRIDLALQNVPENESLTREMLHPLIMELRTYGQTIKGSLFDWPMLPFDPTNIFLQHIAKEIEMISTPDCYLVETDDIELWKKINSHKRMIEKVYFFSNEELYYFDSINLNKLSVIDPSIKDIFLQKNSKEKLASLEDLLQIFLMAEHVLVPCYLLKMASKLGKENRKYLKQKLNNNFCFIWAENSLYFIDREGQELLLPLSADCNKNELEQLFSTSLKCASIQELRTLYRYSGYAPIGVSAIQLMMPYLTQGADLSFAMRLTRDFNPQLKSAFGQMIYFKEKLIDLPTYIDELQPGDVPDEHLFSSIRGQSVQLEYYLGALHTLSKDAKAVSYSDMLALFIFLYQLNTNNFINGQSIFGPDLSKILNNSKEGEIINQLSAECFRLFFEWYDCLAEDEKNWFGSLGFKIFTAQKIAGRMNLSKIGANLLVFQNSLYFRTNSNSQNPRPIIRSEDNASSYDQLCLCCSYEEVLLNHEQCQLLQDLGINIPIKTTLSDLFNKIPRHSDAPLYGAAELSIFDELFFIWLFNSELLSNQFVPSSSKLESFLSQVFVHAKHSYRFALTQPQYGIKNSEFFSAEHFSWILQTLLTEFNTKEEMFTFFNAFLNLTWNNDLELLSLVEYFDIELMKSQNYQQLIDIKPKYAWFVRCIFAHFALQLETPNDITSDIFRHPESLEYICGRLKKIDQLLPLLDQLKPNLRLSTIRFLFDQHLLKGLLVNNEEVKTLCAYLSDDSLIEKIVQLGQSTLRPSPIQSYGFFVHSEKRPELDQLIISERAVGKEEKIELHSSFLGGEDSSTEEESDGEPEYLMSY